MATNTGGFIKNCGMINNPTLTIPSLSGTFGIPTWLALNPKMPKEPSCEMIGLFEKYRILHEELVECGKTEIFMEVQEKQKEIEKYKKTMDEFVKKFLLHES